MIQSERGVVGGVDGCLRMLDWCFCEKNGFQTAHGWRGVSLDLFLYALGMVQIFDVQHMPAGRDFPPQPLFPGVFFTMYRVVYRWAVGNRLPYILVLDFVHCLVPQFLGLFFRPRASFGHLTTGRGIISIPKR